MTSVNQITYESARDVKFHFTLSNFRQHPQRDESFDVILQRDFLGLVLNLGEPIEYSGSELLPGTLQQGHYNIVYLPPTEYTVTTPKGLHHSITMRIDQATLSRSALDFPYLQRFLDTVVNKKSATIRDKHFPIPLRMQEEIDALLYNISKDESMRNLFLEIKAFEIYFAALTDMADLLLGIKPAYITTDPVTKTAVKYLTDHFQETITIEDLAVTLGVNKRKLQEGFKLHTGKTIHEYIIQLKMEAAKKMLRDPSRSVKSIALEVGYSETAFSVAYKKHFNQSPTAVRSEELGNV